MTERFGYTAPIGGGKTTGTIYGVATIIREAFKEGNRVLPVWYAVFAPGMSSPLALFVEEKAAIEWARPFGGRVEPVQIGGVTPCEAP